MTRSPSPRRPAGIAQSANWNKRLIYTFGGGCIGGWYRQGASTGGVTDDFMLRNGYALASSSLNVFGNNCNDLTASESMMMVKERFIESYGPPAHTQGWGCSGGSYAQHQIGDNYPGLLDGIIPGCSFPEVGFATIQFITDAWLLDTYFNTKAAVPWSAEEKRQGHRVLELPDRAQHRGRRAPHRSRDTLRSRDRRSHTGHELRSGACDCATTRATVPNPMACAARCTTTR